MLKVHVPELKNKEWNAAKKLCHPTTANTAVSSNRITVSHEPANHAEEAVPGVARCRYQAARTLSTSRTNAISSPQDITCWTSRM